MKLFADSALPGLQCFQGAPFELITTASDGLTADKLQSADVLICRSVTKVDKALLKNSQIQLIATATSGTDHIDSDYCQQQGINVLSAPGANAQSVVDYVLATLACLQGELKGNRVGIVGVGAVGSRLAKALVHYGYEVVLNDPLRAAAEPRFPHRPLSDIQRCDIISLHLPLSDSGPNASYQLIDDKFLTQLRDGTVLINTARGQVIDEQALIAHAHRLTLCLDVFCGEPNINPSLVAKARLVTPHIAGHAIEAKLRAVHMLHQAIHHSLTLPYKAPYTPKTPGASSRLSLQEIRGFYTPAHESQRLKQQPTAAIFSHLRKQHHYRHEFSHYQQLLTECSSF